MKKVILIAIATASLSTTALAGHRTHLHHAVSPAVLNANASLNASLNGSLNGNGSDHAMHMRNLHDSGYSHKNDVDSAGNLVGNH